MREFIYGNVLLASAHNAEERARRKMLQRERERANTHAGRGLSVLAGAVAGRAAGVLPKPTDSPLRPGIHSTYYFIIIMHNVWQKVLYWSAPWN